MRLSLCLLFTLSLLPFSSFAQIDPWPNSIGIYFDEGATENSASIQGPQTGHAYLVATNVSLTSDIDEWWGGVICNQQVWAELRGAGVNAFSNGPAGLVWFQVECSTPLEIESAVVLADLYFDVTDDETVRLGVNEVVGSQEYSYFGCLGGGEMVLVDPSTGCPSIPCYPRWVATVNGEAPLPARPPTWGAVKALFGR